MDYNPVQMVNKYIITEDKFQICNDNRKTYKNYNHLKFLDGYHLYFHYLELNTCSDLKYLANKVKLLDEKNISLMNKNELIQYITDRIEFQVPEHFKVYIRGPDSLIQKYINFQHVYIPLNRQNEPSGSTVTSIEINNMWYSYPFAKDQCKPLLQCICKEINLMNYKESKIYTTHELAELLNEKLLLQERGS